MVPFLIELEQPYDPDRPFEFDPHDLIRFALGFTDYWAELAIGWLTAGVSADPVVPELREYVANRRHPQMLRHRVARILKDV